MFFFLKMFYSPNHIIQKIVVFIAFLELKGVVGDKGWSRGSWNVNFIPSL